MALDVRLLIVFAITTSHVVAEPEWYSVGFKRTEGDKCKICEGLYSFECNDWPDYNNSAFVDPSGGSFHLVGQGLNISNTEECEAACVDEVTNRTMIWIFDNYKYPIESYYDQYKGSLMEGKGVCVFYPRCGPSTYPSCFTDRPPRCVWINGNQESSTCGTTWCAPATGSNCTIAFKSNVDNCTTCEKSCSMEEGSGEEAECVPYGHGHPYNPNAEFGPDECTQDFQYKDGTDCSECSEPQDCKENENCMDYECVDPCESKLCGVDAICEVLEAHGNASCSCPHGMTGNPYLKCEMIETTPETTPEPEPTKPPKPEKCWNLESKQRCRRILMKGFCGKKYWRRSCCKTCKHGCGNIWSSKRCQKLIPHCRRSNKIRKKCRKSCKQC